MYNEKLNNKTTKKKVNVNSNISGKKNSMARTTQNR